ncbi:MAG TPA: exodeoxyribonuclease VII large subunit [Planctomycetota bacterium]|nr:exodeoxyribonuclease VII large subunit [Planctomycetota bacterium]
MITRRERIDGGEPPDRPPTPAIPPLRGGREQALAARGEGARAPGPISVAEAVAKVKDVLEGQFRFPILVLGEATSVRRPRTGHLYFTLRDRRAALRVVVFAREAAALPCPVEEGAKLVVRGMLTAFMDAGELQLVADKVEPHGIGEHAVRVEALKKRLKAEGLFAPERKRPLPLLPRTIGLVSSPTGAAIRDVLSTIDRRCPRVRVVLSAVRVSGSSAPEIATALRLLDRLVLCDAILLVRGGGAREELQAFDDEVVCRAIAECRAPVVTGVGHETDVSVADLVADLRAPTPTAAAELAVPDLRALARDLDERGARLASALRGRVLLARKRLEACERSFGLRAPAERAKVLRTRLDEIERGLERAVRAALTKSEQALAAAAGKLDTLSPLKVLARGFSLTTKDGAIVRDAATLAPGDEITTRLASGRVRSRVLSERAERASDSGGPASAGSPDDAGGNAGGRSAPRASEQTGGS